MFSFIKNKSYRENQIKERSQEKVSQVIWELKKLLQLFSPPKNKKLQKVHFFSLSSPLRPPPLS